MINWQMFRFKLIDLLVGIAIGVLTWWILQ
jgi:hypothetical protein